MKTIEALIEIVNNQQELIEELQEQFKNHTHKTRPEHPKWVDPILPTDSHPPDGVPYFYCPTCSKPFAGLNCCKCRLSIESTKVSQDNE